MYNDWGGIIQLGSVTEFDGIAWSHLQQLISAVILAN